jgi:hypothetical protein
MARGFVEVFGGGPTGAMPMRASAPPAPRPSGDAPHGFSATNPMERTQRSPGPESAAPETPMAATVAVPTPRTAERESSLPPPNPLMPSRPAVSLRELGPLLWLLGAGLFVLLMLVVWWFRTR